MTSLGLRHRLRKYWQGLIIAAAVSYGQLQDSSWIDVRAAQKHPFVYMLPDEPTGWSPLERVGDSVLTAPLEVARERDWN